MYRLKSTGEIKSQGEIRGMYPNTSFPSQWSAELVANLELDPILESPAPAVTRYQAAYKDGVEQDAKGNWVWKWSIGPVFADNEEATAAEQQAAYIARIDGDQATAVRADRDQRLAECDWMVVKAYETNSNVPAVWEIYRQALRDIPAQAGFPWDVTWPEKP